MVVTSMRSGDYKATGKKTNKKNKYSILMPLSKVYKSYCPQTVILPVYIALRNGALHGTKTSAITVNINWTG